MVHEEYRGGHLSVTDILEKRILYPTVNDVTLMMQQKMILDSSKDLEAPVRERLVQQLLKFVCQNMPIKKIKSKKPQ